MQNEKLTPMMQQFWDVKNQHPDKILLYRMGDFFEMFHDDAITAAPILGIALTARNKNAGNETPMCGVPHHSIGHQINKLLAAGHKVAICDQIEDPKFAKGIVKRAVTRILTPGVVFDPDTLEPTQGNYLCTWDNEVLSFLDISSGEAFFYRMGPETSEWYETLLLLRPSEIILASPASETLKKLLPNTLTTVFAQLPEKEKSQVEARWPSWPEPSQRLLVYALTLQGSDSIFAVADLKERVAGRTLKISTTTLRHLEIFENYRGGRDGTLFWATDRCKTAIGSRRLKSWMQFPLLDLSEISRRQAEIQFWLGDISRLKSLRQILQSMGDIQRRLGKIASPSCHPRDLQALANSLQSGLEATHLAYENRPHALNLQSVGTILSELHTSLREEIPLQFKSGGFIKPNVSFQLDELVELATNAQKLLLDMEAREREATGISSLKIRFNNVFGYYIEITNTHKDKVPKDRYERKQTLANAERYLTKELETLEAKILSAEAKRVELELAIFQELRNKVLNVAADLQKAADAWAELDALSSLAWLAMEQNYRKPEFCEDRLEIRASRHAVIEQVLKKSFVANDLVLKKSDCLLLTGPNMAGKSTIMRQVALTVVLAQMGSFVPASSAKLMLFDQVFTRIGASDSLIEGLSTFMVEMSETAQLLSAAGERTLLVLDEIGRGTSTYDGMSLAQAILENILERKVGLTLFATHFHELTSLTERYKGLCNAHMSIREQGGQIHFQHTLVAGPASKSYGIHVAKLAGLPKSVTSRAAEILRELEARAQFDQPQLTLAPVAAAVDSFDSDDGKYNSGDLLSEKDHQVLERLRGLELPQLTPLAALNTIAEWQRDLS